MLELGVDENLADGASQRDVRGLLWFEGSDGHGFVRRNSFAPEPDDAYVPASLIRRYGLRPGDLVSGPIVPASGAQRHPGLVAVTAINNTAPDIAQRRPQFSRLVPIYPDAQYRLETTQNVLPTRVIDLVAPIGKGQRGLIVAPPKAGKTMLLKYIAHGLTVNYPDVHLMLVLIGERPEEVTDLERSVPQAEVVAATFDEEPDRHTAIAEMALERAKRLVEMGRDVVILLDSITRLTRAYNLDVPQSGRTLSGGIDAAALVPPKKFIGAARNVEFGGSLAVIATCLVDTGSRMDELIYEEFKGTGNMELHLDRRMAEQRIFPAINIERSGTRHEELLLSQRDLYSTLVLRRMVAAQLSSTKSVEMLLDRLASTSTNTAFLAGISKELDGGS